MKLPFYACPSCHKDFRAEVQNPDQNVRCPHCKKIVHLPKKSAAKWFLARDKDKIGPLTLNQLQEYADKSELQRDTMLLKDGDGTWVRAGDFPLLFPEPSATHAAPRYSKRFLAVVASLVFVLLVGGGWIVFSGSRKPKYGPSTKNGENPKKKKQPGKNDENPPTKNGEKLANPNISKLAKRAFRIINAFRKNAGAPPLVFELNLSEECEAHANYLARNPKLSKERIHDEQPNRPGFSKKGKTAARWSFVFLKEPLAKIDEAMANTRMRTAFINPRLEKIGIGYAQSTKHGDILVIDAKRGEGHTIVKYPGPGQTNVPVWGRLKPFGRPYVNVSFPITVQFPTYYSVSNARAIIHWSKWKQELDGVKRGSSIVFYREDQFKPQTTYEVTVVADVNGEPWKKRWRFTTGSAKEKHGPQSADNVLQKINEYRRLAGLHTVSIDQSLTRDCSKHARYLIANADRLETKGDRVRWEAINLRGFSFEGRDAAQRSNVLLGKTPPVQAVDAWMASFYHRSAMLDPRLKSVGIGIEHTNDRKTWATVVDVKGKRGISLHGPPVIYPTDNQRQVPRAFHHLGDVMRPIPHGHHGPAGFPITVHFPGNFRPKPVEANLYDESNKAVPCWVSHPGRPANQKYAAYQNNTICLIPKMVLEPGTKYRAHVRTRRNLVKWEKIWHFQTENNAVQPAAKNGDSVKRIIDKINRVRKWAGLSSVKSAPSYSNGCQAHANYLKLNLKSINPTVGGLSQELQTKPGYSKEGRKAGGRAFMRIDLISPDAIIDDLMQQPKLRPFILDPQWRIAGIGCARHPKQGWITVLDVLGDREFYVKYPARNGRNVPRFGRPAAVISLLPIEIGEVRTGFPITYTFLQHTTNPRFVLEKRFGASWMPVLCEDVEQSVPNSVRIIPFRPLRPETEYRVSLSVYFGDWNWTIAPSHFRTKAD